MPTDEGGLRIQSRFLHQSSPGQFPSPTTEGATLPLGQWCKYSRVCACVRAGMCTSGCVCVRVCVRAGGLAGWHAWEYITIIKIFNGIPRRQKALINHVCVCLRAYVCICARCCVYVHVAVCMCVCTISLSIYSCSCVLYRPTQSRTRVL